jgi:capsular polysaccharide transport system permease protein
MTGEVTLVGRPSLGEILLAQRNVLAALILRDIKTRFGSAPGFLIAIAWPLSHILILVAINVWTGRIAPYGESAILWFAVSMTPFMIVSYTSRFMMIGLVMNRPLLAFPIISVFDILLSRILIEMVVCSCVVACLVLILMSLDVAFMPNDVTMASAAIASAMLLGIGLGILNAIIAMMIPQWTIIYSLAIILFWITSGVYFIPGALDAQLRGYLYYHPFVHGTEWLREAYFSSYNSAILDKAYLLGWGLWSVSAGLVMERLLRGRVLVA